MRYPVTPDGRYFVVRGRLWRCSDPRLDDATRAVHVAALMRARRAVRDAADDAARAAARCQVDTAKIALGERGPVWWTDDAPDYNRHLAVNTPYRAWFATVEEEAVERTVSSPQPEAGPPSRAKGSTR